VLNVLNNASRDDDDVDDDGASSNIPNFNDGDVATYSNQVMSAKLSSDYERVHFGFFVLRATIMRTSRFTPVVVSSRE